MAALLAAALAGTVTTIVSDTATSGITRITAPREPFTWVKRINPDKLYGNCSRQYMVVSDRAPRDMPPFDEGSWDDWRRETRGVDHGLTHVELTLQGRSAEATVLQGMRVRVVKRAGPAAGSVYAGVSEVTCNTSDQAQRNLYADLDTGDRITPMPAYDGRSPSAKPANGTSEPGDHQAARENERGEILSFPYRITDSDPEVIDVGVETGDCDCSWVLELDWAGGGESGTVTIDDGGRPFRTTASATKGVGYLVYDWDTHEWKGKSASSEGG
ncbi:hypothetical protein ABZU32_15750 [Sphaerisporangium sp. NPDC005288]|uniref:hypothetical protein n=1 Tax=Sphaerisporangium sp. NPDC005288 TaxID=3155114 RepID=UPI0033A9EF91